jgi:RimJ/RimL family protein N-acetyltransferase
LSHLPALEGERVRLRAPEERDALTRALAGVSAEIVRMYGRDAESSDQLSAQEAARWLARARAEPWEWVIETAGEAVGSIRLHHVDDLAGEAWLAIEIFREDLHGQGLGSDATRALVRWAAGPPLGLRRIRVRVAEFNARAIKAYKKVGFVAYARDEGAFELDGRSWADELLELQTDQLRL